MSDHLKPQSPELVAALRSHGLKSDEPSQLSDAFRLGWNARALPLAKQEHFAAQNTVTAAWPDFIAPPKYENQHPAWEDPPLPEIAYLYYAGVGAEWRLCVTDGFAHWDPKPYVSKSDLDAATARAEAAEARAARYKAERDGQARRMSEVQRIMPASAEAIIVKQRADIDRLQAAAKTAREDEREACAKLAESLHETSWPDTIAAAIRARSEGGEG